MYSRHTLSDTFLAPKSCVTKGKCVSQSMSKMCHSGYVYCILKIVIVLLLLMPMSNVSYLKPASIFKSQSMYLPNTPVGTI